MKAKTPKEKPKVKFQITLTAYEDGTCRQNIKGTRTANEVIGITEVFKQNFINDLINPKP